MRDRLAALYAEDNQRVHTFTALFSKYSRSPEGSNMVCLVRVRYCDRYACDHAWIHRSGHMKRLELHPGDEVQFEAKIGKYARTGTFYHVSEIEYDYSLIQIRNFEILNRRLDWEKWTLHHDG